MTLYFLKRLAVAVLIFHLLTTVLLYAVWSYLNHVRDSAGWIFVTERNLFLVCLFAYAVVVGTVSARLSSKLVKKPH